MIEQCKYCKNKENINGIIGCVYMDADCQNGEKYEAQIITNADRIRTMSDEELARMLHEQRDSYCKNLPECGYLLDTPNGIPAEKCIDCALEWLKLPAKEEAEKDAAT